MIGTSALVTIARHDRQRGSPATRGRQDRLGSRTSKALLCIRPHAMRNRLARRAGCAARHRRRRYGEAPRRVWCCRSTGCPISCIDVGCVRHDADRHRHRGRRRLPEPAGVSRSRHRRDRAPRAPPAPADRTCRSSRRRCGRVPRSWTLPPLLVVLVARRLSTRARPHGIGEHRWTRHRVGPPGPACSARNVPRRVVAHRRDRSDLDRRLPGARHVPRDRAGVRPFPGSRWSDG